MVNYTQTEVENSSLAAHVAMCSLRYQALEDRISTVEHAIDGLDKKVSQVYELILANHAQQEQRWTQAQIAIITVLTAVVGWFFAHGSLLA